jgi:hypothetical protein
MTPISRKAISYKMQRRKRKKWTSRMKFSNSRPVCVSKNDKVLEAYTIRPSGEEPTMSGGIEVDDLLPMTDELAEKGSQSILGQTLAVKWEEYIPAV